MLLNVGPSTAFFVSTPVISGAIMETAARECDAAADRAGSWSAAEEKVDAMRSMIAAGTAIRGPLATGAEGGGAIRAEKTPVLPLSEEQQQRRPHRLR
jgi:hypothetical protein